MELKKMLACRRTFYILVLIFLQIIMKVEENNCQACLSHNVQVNESDLGVRMCRGVNIGNALEAPNEGDWGVVIKDKYFEIIREAGFDTVRIPIRWSSHADNSPPFKIDENFLRRVDWVINKSLEQNLITIINIHHYEEIMEKPAEHRDRFIALWKQISEHYKDYPNMLYFELLNEPHGNLTSSLWNKLIQDSIEVIRETNQDRKIIVGPVDWNNVYRLEDLIIPANDKNIIVTFHFYTPFEFTHQGAEWISPSPSVGKRWTESEAERNQITNELDIAAQWAVKHNNIPIFLGEFGAYSKADMASRVRWTYFVAREAEKRNIAWCYWEFCSGFGVYDPVKNEWREDLLNALIPVSGTHYISAYTEYGEVFGSGWYNEGSYATLRLSEMRLGVFIQDVFDHFEGLGPKDRVIDERTVEIYVDGSREIRAVWRKDHTRLLFISTIIIGICLITSLMLIRRRLGRSARSSL
jgi:endoglucanase